GKRRGVEGFVGHYDQSTNTGTSVKNYFTISSVAEPFKLKAGNLHVLNYCDQTTKHCRVPLRGKRMHYQRIARDEVSFVWLHYCNLFLPASSRMWVRSSTSGIRRDDVSMSRFSVSDLHN